MTDLSRLTLAELRHLAERVDEELRRREARRRLAAVARETLAELEAERSNTTAAKPQKDTRR